MITFIGILGSAIVLLGFILNQFNKLSSNSFWYDLINFIGSVLLLIYAIDGKAYPFIVVNSVWGLFSLKDVVLGFKRNEIRK
jgi:lipid-A-disaccharide synthase-like uncharacterized protein